VVSAGIRKIFRLLATAYAWNTTGRQPTINEPDCQRMEEARYARLPYPLWAWAAAEGRCPDAIPAAGQQDSSCHVRSALSGRASCGKSDKHDLQLDGQEDGREQQEEV
uniref:Uncharacterized protein n=1 Tax=Aegilops tauschii subsp. strangulata TaxID=200361 RepID=A0A453QBS8_AEGTS